MIRGFVIKLESSSSSEYNLIILIDDYLENLDVNENDDGQGYVKGS